MDGSSKTREAQADLGPGEAAVEGEEPGGVLSSAALQPSRRSVGRAGPDGERAQQEDCRPDEANTNGRCKGLMLHC